MGKTSARRPREIFLSHASRDRRFTQRLAATLRDHGLPVWYSETNLVGAQQWHDEIGRALERCDWFVLVLSPSATRSVWVKRELSYALRDLRYDNHIVPILHKPCDFAGKLSWTLPGFQIIDFTADHERGCEDLLRVWGLGYAGGG